MAAVALAPRSSLPSPAPAPNADGFRVPAEQSQFGRRSAADRRGPTSSVTPKNWRLGRPKVGKRAPQTRGRLRLWHLPLTRGKRDYEFSVPLQGGVRELDILGLQPLDSRLQPAIFRPQLPKLGIQRGKAAGGRA
jgi:hypothetical protein